MPQGIVQNGRLLWDRGGKDAISKRKERIFFRPVHVLGSKGTEGFYHASYLTVLIRTFQIDY